MPVGIGLGGSSLPHGPLLVYPEAAPPATYSFEAGPWNGAPDIALPTLTQRSATFRLGPGDNSELSFTIDGRIPEAGQISEVLTAVGIRRNGKLLDRMLVGVSGDTLDADSHRVQFAGADLRAVLSRRFVNDHDTLVYSSVDQGTLGWDLINVTQSRPAGSLGIVPGNITTGTVVSQTLTAGAGVGDTINTMAGSADRFDWAITPIDGTPNYSYDVWASQRGTDRQTVLDYPGRIQSATRNLDPGTFANAIRASGASGLAAQLLDSPTILTDGYPRMEALVADTNIATLSGLASWAAGQLATSQEVVPSWTVTLAPNAWGGPDDFWLGDPVIMAVHSPPRFDRIVESLRVQEIALSFDDGSDAVTAAVTLGAPRVDRRWLLRALDKRLRSLEKR